MTTSESKNRFFLQNESIRIDSRSESNRIDSNRELECSSSWYCSKEKTVIFWPCGSYAKRTCRGHYVIRTYYRSKSKRETTTRKWIDNICDDCSNLGLKLLEATKHAVRRRAWISAV